MSLTIITAVCRDGPRNGELFTFRPSLGKDTFRFNYESLATKERGSYSLDGPAWRWGDWIDDK